MANKISSFLLKQLVDSFNHWYEISHFTDTLEDVPPDELCVAMNGLYYCENGDGTFTGCTNEDLCCWCEDFQDELTCVLWLEGKVDSNGDPY